MVTERDEWVEVRRKAVLCVLRAWRTGNLSALPEFLVDDIEVDSLDIIWQEESSLLRGKENFFKFIVRHRKQCSELELLDFLLGVGGGLVALLWDGMSFRVWEFQFGSDGKVTRLSESLSAGHDFGVSADFTACTKLPERYAEWLRERCGCG